MIYTPQTFPIFILIIIPPVSKFVIILTVTLHTTYLTQQEVVQIFIIACISMIVPVNLLINKRLKCVSFYNNFENLAKISVTFALSNKSLPHQIILALTRWLLRVLTLWNEAKVTGVRSCLTSLSCYREQRFLRITCLKQLRKGLQFTTRGTPDPLMPGKLLPDVLERPNEGLSVPFVSLLTISYAQPLYLNQSFSLLTLTTRSLLFEKIPLVLRA